MLLADFPPLFLRVFALLFGLVWGSFLNVVIHRLPRGMSLVHPPSHCPACRTPIAAYRNVPVLGWLFLRGRASCCGAPISARYPFVELCGGILSVAVLESVVFALPPGAAAVHALMVYLAHLALVLGLLAAAFIDLEHMIIPDTVSLGGALLGLATSPVRDLPWIDSLLGGAVGFAIVYVPFDLVYGRLRGKPGMGLGDAKLLLCAGTWFGAQGALFVLGAGAIQGTVATLVMLLFGRRPEEPEAVKREREELLAELATLSPEERAEVERELALDPLADEPEEGLGKARIAFGPFLILAMLECVLLGRERIFAWILEP
ncbi:MAG: prepilin peptidase [Deltaproteobacteria bacterium]|nr:prepilin peptidase [Deltaproteobacteria bacterium]